MILRRSLPGLLRSSLGVDPSGQLIVKPEGLPPSDCTSTACRRVRHFRDWHFVPRDMFGKDVSIEGDDLEKLTGMHETVEVP
jgi:hypothetical protein